MSGERLTSYVQQTEARKLLRPGITDQKQNAADAVESFTEGDRTDEDNNVAQRCRILIDTNAARTARGVDPVSGGLGYLREQGEEFWLEGPEDIANFRWINDVATEQVTITYTMYYRAAP